MCAQPFVPSAFVAFLGAQQAEVDLTLGLATGGCVFDACVTDGSCSVTTSNANGGGRSGTNGIRRCGAASSSTIGWGGEPDRAIDGNTNTRWGGGSCTHTDHAGAWWQLDLGAASTVTRVDLYHRSDCCQNRLVGAKIVVSSTSDFTSGTVCGTRDDSRTVPETDTCGDGLVGQFVTVHWPDDPASRALTICEVDIWGYIGTPIMSPGALVDRSGNSRTATIHGNAFIDDTGLHLDGDGDFATLADFDYESDGSFSVSIWARKSSCFAASASVSAAWETLYAHVRDAAWGINQPDNSQLLMQVGCGMAAGAHSNVQAGSFLRVSLVGSGRQDRKSVV
jgi:hypothetical protein